MTNKSGSRGRKIGVSHNPGILEKFGKRIMVELGFLNNALSLVGLNCGIRFYLKGGFYSGAKTTGYPSIIFWENIYLL